MHKKQYIKQWNNSCGRLVIEDAILYPIIAEVEALDLHFWAVVDNELVVPLARVPFDFVQVDLAAAALGEDPPSWGLSKRTKSN